MKINKSKKPWAIAGVLLVSCIWGCSFALIKISLGSISYYQFVCFRFVLAALVLALLLNKKLMTLSKAKLGIGYLVGLPLFAGFILQTAALNFTKVGNVSFISGVYVVLVPVLSFFFYRKISVWQILIGLLTLFGLYVFSAVGGLAINRGDILASGSAVCYAFHFLLISKYCKILDTMVLTFLQTLATATYAFIVAVAMGMLAQPVVLNHMVIFTICFCAVFSTALAYYIQSSAQKVLTATQTTVFFTSESVYGAFFGWLLLDELFTLNQYIGAAIMGSCMVLSVLLPYLQERSAQKAAACKPAA